jgi:hypothetical protein
MVVAGPHGWPTRLSVNSDHLATPNTSVEIGVRPEHLRVTSCPDRSGWTIVAREFLGDKIYYTLSKEHDRLSALSDAHTPFTESALVNIEPIADRLLFFDLTSGERVLS